MFGDALARAKHLSFRATGDQPTKPRRIDPLLVHLPVSGWHSTAVGGSRKRITTNTAVEWPLRHGSQRCRLSLSRHLLVGSVLPYI